MTTTHTEGIPLSLNRADRADRTNRAVLDDVYAWLKRFIITPSDDDLYILTLWAAHTWLINDLPSTPRLQLDSIAPGSGKSTTLEHLGRLCRDPSHMASITSAALLSRMINARPRTLLLDEVDRALDPKAEATKDLIAILNSGYRKGATRPVLVPVKGGEWDPQEMSTYAPVALAGNSPRLPDDTRSRIIRIVLMPDADGSAEETNWEDHAEPAAALCESLEAWSETVAESVRALRPEMPEGCKGRNRERWAPLLRVAVAAGGEWPHRVYSLIQSDLEEQRLLSEEGLQRIPPAISLVADIKRVFDAEPHDFIATTDLVNKLIFLNPELWSRESEYGRDLTAQRMGRMLTSSWRIHSQQRGDNGGRARGYSRRQFATAWRQVEAMMPHGSHDSHGLHGSPEGVPVQPHSPTYLPAPTPAKEYANHD